MVTSGVFAIFGAQILKVATQREMMVKNILGKCLVTYLNIICQRDFSISSYLLTSKIAVSVLFCNLKIWKF